MLGSIVSIHMEMAAMALDCGVGKGTVMCSYFETSLSKMSLGKVIVVFSPFDANQGEG